MPEGALTLPAAYQAAWSSIERDVLAGNNVTQAAVQALANKTTQVCYALGTQASGCANVNIAATPNVPEPGTMILLGAGLAGLAFWRRRG